MLGWLFRPFLVVLYVLPLLTVVLLSAPAWLTWPFLPAGRQRVVLEVIDRLVRWTRTVMTHHTAPTPRRRGAATGP
ncbi:hypothetical protein OYE22_17035 [Streptomyces sp. 71268]|uniref:hypothetical protein n=1 Tax=Streptomyces sp. 71268 TaxID=3002640 RepID=UPI0023F76948|nr:hypothetical protein [Streptomyces sp. 71268]WEV26711.1 hypothetical protein OYE22_17035 [Streptomyces sp. 71268]